MPIDYNNLFQNSDDLDWIDDYSNPNPRHEMDAMNHVQPFRDDFDDLFDDPPERQFTGPSAFGAFGGDGGKDLETPWGGHVDDPVFGDEPPLISIPGAQSAYGAFGFDGNVLLDGWEPPEFDPPTEIPCPSGQIYDKKLGCIRDPGLFDTTPVTADRIEPPQWSDWVDTWNCIAFDDMEQALVDCPAPPLDQRDCIPPTRSEIDDAYLQIDTSTPDYLHPSLWWPQHPDNPDNADALDAYLAGWAILTANLDIIEWVGCLVGELSPDINFDLGLCLKRQLLGEIPIGVDFIGKFAPGEGALGTVRKPDGGALVFPQEVGAWQGWIDRWLLWRNRTKPLPLSARTDAFCAALSIAGTTLHGDRSAEHGGSELSRM